MKKLVPLYVIPFVCMTIFLSACSKSDFTYSDGTTGTYADFNGQWLLINYWAEWCKPCAEEIPELNQWAKSRSDVKVIGINYDAMTMEEQNRIIQRMKIEFPVIQTVTKTPFDKHFSYVYPQALPTSILITPTGTVKTILYGPQTHNSLNAAMNR